MRIVLMTRADVYAARTRVRLDKILGRKTPVWIKRLAAERPDGAA